MTTINLLNWRETRIKTQNNIFYIITGLVVVSCLFVVLCIDMVIKINIHSVKKDIDYINAEDNKIEPKISEVKGLQQQKELLLSRRAIVDSLQDSRTLIVKILDNLAKITPNGIVFNELSKKKDLLTIDAIGDTNAAVSNLMKNVERLRWVKDAKLSEIKTIDPSNKEKSKNSSSADNGGKVAFKLELSLAASALSFDTSPSSGHSSTPRSGGKHQR